jgi:tetratricopeptide (TPR) repeat protein
MRFSLRCLPAFVVAACLCLATGVRAENEGQDDYSTAREKLLAANSVIDLNDAIELLESGLQKGLSADDAKDAKLMLTGALLRRAEFRAKLIAAESSGNLGRLRQQSLEDLEKALKNDPQLAQAHLLIARLQSLQPGDRVAAEKAAEKAAELAKDDNETKVTALILLANLSEDSSKRLVHINNALKIAPKNRDALRVRAMILIVAGKVEDAVADLESVVKSDPTDAAAQNDLGLALLMLKRDDAAMEAFDAAIKQEPEQPRWYVNRARVHLQARHFEKALTDLNQTLKLVPGNPLVLLLRARANQGAGKLDQARTDAEAGLKDIRGIPPEALAILSLGSENLTQAAADLEELAKIVPNNSQLLSQLGLFYLAAKQPRKAVEKCKAALEKDPENFIALRTRADALLGIGKHAEAIADYEQAIKLRPRDESVLNNLAWVLATSPEDAVRDGKRSIEVATQACRVSDYRKAHILSTLAAAYAENGQWDKAVEWSKKAVELEHEDAETAEQLKKELANYEEKKPWREKMDHQDEQPKPDEKGDNQADDAAAKKDG